jgi:cytochrome c oxidase subunit 2
VPRGTRVEVFRQIYEVFLVLGTLVGVVVVAYMLYNAYAYRRGADYEGEVERPELGELPSGSGGGRKLFLSLTLSAVIVVSLIAWTYGTLLYVESGAATGPGSNALDVDVVAYQFGWEFVYPNGTTTSTLRVPEDRAVRLHVTSRDVFHNFGIPGLRVKTDAIPGHTTQTWFRADEPGEHTVHCYELCGAGHSFMTAPVVVEERTEWQSWYANTTGT